MSSSTIPADFLADKDGEEDIESGIQIRPATKDPKGCPNIAPSCHLSDLQGGGGGDDSGGGRKDTEKDIEPVIPTRTTSQDPDGCPNVHLSDLQSFREVQVGEDDVEKPAQELEGSRSPTRMLGESEVAEDEEDGFKTPDSLEHRIPVMTECPPAPMKTNRKIPFIAKRNFHGIDLSRVIELLLFPPPPPDCGRTIKKPRREGGGGGGGNNGGSELL